MGSAFIKESVHDSHNVSAALNRNAQDETERLRASRALLEFYLF